MRFADKVAVITGGASGIGAATAFQLARAGAKVMIADISPDGAETARRLSAQGFDVAYERVDVCKEEHISAVVRATVSRWSRLDIMVANAGISGVGHAEATSLESWQRVLDVNLTGVFLCIKHAVPAMRANGGGAIINTASVMGLVGPRGAVAYGAAKGAIVNLTRATALDYARENIRINAVCPGYLNDPTSSGGAVRSEAEMQQLIARHPIGRIGRPEDVAYAIAFLASDEASFITGTCLVVDGGYTAQ
jgi:NAD(P)-dependent dehydrogenase (short-subunit alcohol dehydrogenase family)